MKENPEEKLASDSVHGGAADTDGIAPPVSNEVGNPDVAVPKRESDNPGVPDIVDGEIVVVAPGGIPPRTTSKYANLTPPSVAEELDGIAATGGAVGALVLGIWSILGSLLTYWSIINGVLGLVLGIWGLTSKHPRIAWIGILLCMIGCFLSMISISEIIADFWKMQSEEF